MVCSHFTIFDFSGSIIYSSGVFPDLARFDQSDNPIHLTSVNCSGSETKITQCSHSMSTSSDHQNDVGVKCGKG